MILRAKKNKKTLNTHIPYLDSLILTWCSIIPQRSSGLVFLFSFCVSMVLQRPCIRSLLVFFFLNTAYALCVMYTLKRMCLQFFFLAQAQYTLCVSCHVHAQACVCVCHTCNVSLLLVFFFGVFLIFSSSFTSMLVKVLKLIEGGALGTYF